jgi:methanogenic corrinoid protein MtbC1
VIAALDGWHVTQLGADLPPKDIAFAASAVGATAVAVSGVVLQHDLDGLPIPR